MRTDSVSHRLALALALAAILLAGCTATTQPIPDPGYQAKDYAWAQRSGTVTYDDAGGLTRTVTFENKQSTLFAYESLSDGTTDTIRFYPGADTMAVEGLRIGTFIKLQGDTHFSKLDHVTKQGEYRVVSYCRGDVALAGTDSGGVFEYDHVDSFQYRGLAGTKNITAVAVYTVTGKPNSFYAGTAAGDLYSAPSDYSTWTKLATAGIPATHGAVTNLVVDNAGVLYATFESATGIYKMSGGTWQISTLLSGSKVTALSSFGSLILAGSATGEIGYITGSLISSAQFDCGAVKNFVLWGGASAKFFAATDQGVYESTTSSLFKWTLAAWAVRLSGDPIRNVYSITAGTTLSFLAADGIYVLPSGTGSTLTLIHVQDTLRNTSRIYADNGLLLLAPQDFVGHNTNGVWGKYHKGLQFGEPDVPGGLLLLKGQMAVGDSWFAGTLIRRTLNDDTRVAYRYTARVIDHLDRLILAHKTHEDVLVVRYAVEEPKDSVGTQPYWVVYYKKGFGPVLVDENRPGETAPLQMAIQ
jgi:hypothetical protein